MSQLVLIHGPGAGGCSAGYQYQLEHFPESLAPDLPGHPDGESLSTIAEYTEWYMKALDRGLNRDEATLSATRKYAKKWGKDKVGRGL